MIKTILYLKNIISKKFCELDDDHPYFASFIFSSAITGFVLFVTPYESVNEADLTPSENIEFINIDDMQLAARRVVKKEISTEKSDTADSNPEPVEKATGTSDDPNAVDLAFYPNIAPPRPIGQLKKLYPNIAKEMSVEAIVNVELTINEDGKVVYVKIIGIRLSKPLQNDMTAVVTKAFTADTIKILNGAQFTPPVVDGKHIPVKMVMPLKFRLE